MKNFTAFYFVVTKMLLIFISKLSIMPYKFDVNRRDFYLLTERGSRTKNRIIEIAEAGMELVGVGEFGYRNILSGLYIEMVWSYSEQAWREYMDWAIKLIREKSNSAI